MLLGDCEHSPPPDAKVRLYLVYLKYWTLNLMPLMVTLRYYSIRNLASKSLPPAARPALLYLVSSIIVEPAAPVNDCAGQWSCRCLCGGSSKIAKIGLLYPHEGIKIDSAFQASKVMGEGLTRHYGSWPWAGWYKAAQETEVPPACRNSLLTTTTPQRF